MSLPTFVVLGMHKSGTSLIARALHEAGVAMVPPWQPRGVNYPKEKFEWREFKSVNCRLLRTRLENSLGIALGAPLLIDETIVADAAQTIKQASGRFAHWGFKDPRTTLTYDFWAGLLPVHQIVGVYRDPREVALHYAHQAQHPWGRMRKAEAALRHCAHYHARLASHIEISPYPSIVVDFAALLAGNREWERLSDFVGRRLPDVRDPALYHCRVRAC